jgi:D-alanyl-D-alanine carboxypeptidase
LKVFLKILLLFSLFEFALLNINANSKPVDITPSILKSSNYASIVINSKTGKVLFSKNADQKRYPASLTKMMTLYLTFDVLKKKKLYPLKKLKVSKYASEQPKSNIDLKAGNKITVRKAIHAIIVKSANDAAVVLGESIAGNRKKFINLMNKTAKKLGMKSTNFQNAHGLHHKKQYTTARDMAKLAIALKKDFPKYYHLFSMTSFKYRGKEIHGHNRVLQRYEWIDGLKTGYINASGFNLATSAKKPEGNLVAIVMGSQTARIRDDHMVNLLDNAYARLSIRGKVKSKKSSRIQLLHSKKGVFQYASTESQKITNTTDQLCWDVLEIH